MRYIATSYCKVDDKPFNHHLVSVLKINLQCQKCFKNNQYEAIPGTRKPEFSEDITEYLYGHVITYPNDINIKYK